jgi:hypothetical protein
MLIFVVVAAISRWQMGIEAILQLCSRLNPVESVEYNLRPQLRAPRHLGLARTTGLFVVSVDTSTAAAERSSTRLVTQLRVAS